MNKLLLIALSFIGIITFSKKAEACTQPDIDPIAGQTVCDFLILPEITGIDLTGNEAYFTSPNGGGTMYMEGDTISSDMTLYAYDADGACEEEEMFTITIISSPEFNNSQVLQDCDSVQIPNITGSNLSGNESYYTGPNQSGNVVNVGDYITTNGVIYLYDETGTVPNCATDMLIIISIPDSLNAGMDHDSTVTPGGIIDLTNIIDEDNGGEFVETSNPLSGQFDDVINTLNTNGLNPGIYTFEYIVDGCYPDTAIITITIADTTNSIISFDELSVQVYPNPFTNEIHITQNYDELYIIDASGRVVFKSNRKESQINLTHLKSGLYTLILSFEDRIGQMRLVKK